MGVLKRGTNPGETNTTGLRGTDTNQTIHCNQTKHPVRNNN